MRKSIHLVQAKIEKKSNVCLEMAFKPLGWGRVQAWAADGTNAKNRVRQLT